jgi:Uncharacterized conserved protein
MMKKKVGLIVNPIAGVGGRTGLKGSDGEKIQRKARALGGEPVAPARAIEALQQLTSIMDRIELVTYPYEMGEEEAVKCGFDPIRIGLAISRGKTRAIDTKNAAREMLDLKVDLIIFAGGDGTARDICEAIDQKVPVIGIPGGVKIFSGVFAVNPKKAGDLIVKFVEGEVSLRESEVMDIDEDAFRRGRLSAELYGYLSVPYEMSLVQSVKSGTPVVLDEKLSQEAITECVVENMDNSYYVLGPGTTVKGITDKLGIKKTLLGVDVIHEGKVVALDLDEKELLKMIKGQKAKIIVSPIGGQGFIFGRGNQQISPEVIREVGKENIMIIATKSKLSSIGIGQPLRVDTGDDEIDKMLSGYVRVVTGYNEETVVKVC